MKKIQEKLRKCQTDVEATREKYEASLNDLNSYNAKYIEDMNEVFSKCQEFEKSRIDFFKKTMYEIHQCVDLSVEPRFSSIFTTLHNTIGQIEPDHDLRWWSHNHGADMAMNWPMFEEYSPDLQNITKKEKKSSQLGSDGITITSIRHKPEHMPHDYNGQQSRSSRTSQDSNPPPANVNNHQAPQVSRQKSYDETLNPFGCEDEEDDAEDQKETTPSASQPETSTISVPVESSNPFADEPDQVDEDSTSTPRDDDETLPVTVRALYDYVKTEDDELSFKAG
ncbi:hypothetical protein KUTeg_023335 [Tegillarca granosa]|uniref:F-BAR domain-containing protein n=1 Tax=Tegillarca granosa TaxID=220873 RepID=A0ABQ9E727_TEGGR|nr:hypothetical protein KUTeg_023335 [Tegillarca granosa]